MPIQKYEPKEGFIMVLIRIPRKSKHVKNLVYVTPRAYLLEINNDYKLAGVRDDITVDVINDIDDNEMETEYGLLDAVKQDLRVMKLRDSNKYLYVSLDKKRTHQTNHPLRKLGITQYVV